MTKYPSWRAVGRYAQCTRHIRYSILFSHDSQPAHDDDIEYFIPILYFCYFHFYFTSVFFYFHFSSAHLIFYSFLSRFSASSWWWWLWVISSLSSLNYFFHNYFHFFTFTRHIQYSIILSSDSRSHDEDYNFFFYFNFF